MSRTVSVCLAASGCVGIVAAGAFAGSAGARTAYENAGSGLVFMQMNCVGGNSVAVYDRRGDSTTVAQGGYVRHGQPGWTARWAGLRPAGFPGIGGL